MLPTRGDLPLNNGHSPRLDCGLSRPDDTRDQSTWFRTLEAPMALLHSTVQYLEIKTFATQPVEWLASFVLLTV